MGVDRSHVRRHDWRMATVERRVSRSEPAKGATRPDVAMARRARRQGGDDALGEALDDRDLADPGSSMRTGLFFLRRLSTLHAADLVVAREREQPTGVTCG